VLLSVLRASEHFKLFAIAGLSVTNLSADSFAISSIGCFLPGLPPTNWTAGKAVMLSDSRNHCVLGRGP